MRFPNLRYGNPTELTFYAQFYPEKERVRRLARQLQRMEHEAMMRQMNIQAMPLQLGLVAGKVITFGRPKEKPRLVDAVSDLSSMVG
jgi:hypothetical protein